MHKAMFQDKHSLNVHLRLQKMGHVRTLKGALPWVKEPLVTGNNNLEES